MINEKHVTERGNTKVSNTDWKMSNKKSFGGLERLNRLFCVKSLHSRQADMGQTNKKENEKSTNGQVKKITKIWTLREKPLKHLMK